MNSSKRRGVYLREDQWRLIDAMLIAAEYNIASDIDNERPGRTGQDALKWCLKQISEIRAAIGFVP